MKAINGKTVTSWISTNPVKANLAIGGVIALLAMTPVAAYAQDAKPIEGVLEWIVGVLQGAIARSIAIIAVCFLGFMAMTGRLAWTLAGSIILGIAFVFGAATLVDAISGTVK